MHSSVQGSGLRVGAQHDDLLALEPINYALPIDQHLARERVGLSTSHAPCVRESAQQPGKARKIIDILHRFSGELDRQGHDNLAPRAEPRTSSPLAR